MEKTLVVKNLKGTANVTIAASGDWTTGELDLSKRAYERVFALGYTFTGDGTIKIEYQASLDNRVWVTPGTGNDVATGLTEGSDILVPTPIPCAFIRFKITETGTAHGIVLTNFSLFVQ